MSSAVLSRDALRPQATDGLGRGATLALLAHGLLIAALAMGVRWRTSEPEGVSAELWAAVPQVAAPPAAEPAPVRVAPAPAPKVEPAPPPTPRVDAQIAIEKERERKRLADEAEKKALAENAKAQKAAADKRQREEQARQKAEDERLAQQREENIKRMMGQVGGTGAPGSTGTAARDAGPSAGYAGRIKARIKPNIVLTDDVPGNPVAEVEVRCAPDGTIVGRRIVKPSGVKHWDDAVLRAIDRTEVLPRDVDGRVPGTLIIAFRPRD